jgi:hypothetical protein
VNATAKGGVSVVVCTHDLARLEMLTASLESVRAQTVRPEEVVVVGDGCAELAAVLRERAGPERIVALDGNRGLSAARNAGVEQVPSRWVAFLDDDATADPRWLEWLAEAGEATGAVGSGGWSVPRFVGKEPGWFPPELLWTVGCSYEGLPTERAVVRNVFGGCAMFLTQALRGAGGFDVGLGRMGSGGQGGEEAEFCLRIAEQDPGTCFVHEPRAVVRHCVPPERGRIRYVMRRCFAEGRSKGRVARLRGRGALSSESSFVACAPGAVVGHLRAGRVGAACALAAGVLAAAGGFLTSLLAVPRSSAGSSGSWRARPAKEGTGRAGPGEGSVPAGRTGRGVDARGESGGRR